MIARDAVVPPRQGTSTGFGGLRLYPKALSPGVLRSLPTFDGTRASHTEIERAGAVRLLRDVTCRLRWRDASPLAVSLAPHAAQEVDPHERALSLIAEAYAPANRIAETYRRRRHDGFLGAEVADVLDRAAMRFSHGEVAEWPSVVADLRRNDILNLVLDILGAHDLAGPARLAALHRDLFAGLSAADAFAAYQNDLVRAVVNGEPLPDSPALHAADGALPRGISALAACSVALRSLAGFSTGRRERDDARRWYVLRLAELFALSTGLVPGLHFPADKDIRSPWHRFVSAALILPGLGDAGLDTLLKTLGRARHAPSVRDLLISLAKTGAGEVLPSRLLAGECGFDVLL